MQPPPRSDLAIVVALLRSRGAQSHSKVQGIITLHIYTKEKPLKKRISVINILYILCICTYYTRLFARNTLAHKQLGASCLQQPLHQ